MILINFFQEFLSVGDSLESEVPKSVKKPLDSHKIPNEVIEATDNPKEAVVHVPPAKPVSKYVFICLIMLYC